VLAAKQVEAFEFKERGQGGQNSKVWPLKYEAEANHMVVAVGAHS